MDRAYQNMLAVAKERLKGRNPYQIASNANMIYEENFENGSRKGSFLFRIAAL